MDFVDDVDFVFSFDRGVFDLIDQLTDLIDAVIARGIDFDDVWMGTIGDREAVLAFAALVPEALFAV